MSIKEQQHIEECLRLLTFADAIGKLTPETSKAIGYLILAVDQLASVVKDLASKQDKTTTFLSEALNEGDGVYRP